ncbi:MAG: DUF1223 domain-containing protein [Opitutus sp.]|nr:DUF1223 domain-containing protein [Opitutus sp.]
MRPFLFFAVTLALGTAAARATEPARWASGPERVALIELYTSEGCSSCPPAERWLGTLRDDPALWKNFVPVAFHVDYWNRLGWPDRFATREFTARQYAQAAAWSSGSVYTPCFVREGVEWRPRGEKISAPVGALAGALTASYDGAVLRAEFAPALPRAGERFEIYAALLGGGIVSKVTGGENSGETLRHEFVALALVRGAPGVALPLPAEKISGVPRRALAV